MAGLSIGYARVSTEEQDLTAQRDGLGALGVDLRPLLPLFSPDAAGRAAGPHRAWRR